MTRVSSAIPDVLIVLGLVAIAVGVGLVYVPAGIGVGGALAAALGLQMNADRAAAPVYSQQKASS